MNLHDCAWFQEHLDDDDLAPEERRRLEADAELCASCAPDLAAARKLRLAVAQLPREIDPPDAWRAIERRGTSARLPLLAAAAVALSLLGARVLIHPVPPERAWQSEVATANAAFRTALDANPDLDPEVRAIIEKNLADIDRAIAEIDRALARNPSSPMLRRALVAMEQQRLDVLHQLTLSSKPG